MVGKCPESLFSPTTIDERILPLLCGMLLRANHRAVFFTSTFPVLRVRPGRAHLPHSKMCCLLNRSSSSFSQLATWSMISWP
jgi:hypothetical protein